MTVIVSSTIKSNIVQADGRLSIVEVHVSNAGEEITRSYKAPADTDMETLLAEHAISIGKGLESAEAGQIVSNAMSGINIVGVVPKYITQKKAYKEVIKALLIADSDTARKMMPTIMALTDDDINNGFANKLVKIRKRQGNLNSIQTIVDMDIEDIE
ncbi:MAG: hypothetical protein ACUZ8I_07810 [Candidatus Scalindua sp.]